MAEKPSFPATITLVGVCDAVELDAPYEGAKSYTLRLFLRGEQPDPRALDAMARKEIGLLQVPDDVTIPELPKASEQTDLVSEQDPPEKNDGRFGGKL